MDELKEIQKPLEHASTLSSSCYTAEEFYQLERKRVFHESWQYICRMDQVENPGDFVTHDIAGEPVLVMRDKEGTLRAVANVCRHRAARVEARQEGHATRFRCRYHGWAYDLKGNLVGTPDFDDVCGFEKAEHPLPPYHVGVAGPFVFVHLGKSPEPLEKITAPLIDSIEPQIETDLKFHSRKSWTVNCNWKVFVDNYQDGGYHIPTLHPDLAKVVDMSTYETQLHDHSSLQLSPLRNQSSVRKGEAALYWWAYPNFMVNVYDGVMDVNIVMPLGPDKCLVLFDYYFKADASDSHIKESIEVADQVQDEDIEICEEVQRGLSTKQYLAGRFSVRRESGTHLFHKLVASAVLATRAE